MFIGYSLAHKGYLCLNPTRRIFISRNVIFHPLDFPSTSKFVSSSSTSQPSSLSSITNTFTTASTQTLPPLFNSFSSSLVVPTTPPSTQVPWSHVFAPASNSSPSFNIHSVTTQAKASIFKPKVYTTTKHPLPIIPLPCEPKIVKQALQDPIWLPSMQAKFDVLPKSNTWTLVPFDSHMTFVELS